MISNSPQYRSKENSDTFRTSIKIAVTLRQPTGHNLLCRPSLPNVTAMGGDILLQESCDARHKSR
jgi:hypothetical protein